MYCVNSQRLVNAATDLSITNLDLTSGAAVTTKGVKISNNVGFLVLTVKEDKSGGLGDVDIYAEYSDDDVTYYRTYTSDFSGTITAEGNIATTLGNATRRIVHTARLAKYVRYVFDPDANSRITADITYQEQF